MLFYKLLYLGQLVAGRNSSEVLKLEDKIKFTKSNTIQCVRKMLINPNLMLKKKKLNLQNLRAHFAELGRFFKVRMEVILKSKKKITKT